MTFNDRNRAGVRLAAIVLFLLAANASAQSLPPQVEVVDRPSTTQRNDHYAGNKAPAAGDQWRFISARCNLSKAFGRRQEFSAAVPLSAIDFHINPEYGTMKFSR